ncbi:MAG: dihydrofolate reductase [Benjaminiella poitrasii]|nr:MAG: dihydrofolate reductase [Benjaminiella poitrasii]
MITNINKDPVVFMAAALAKDGGIGYDNGLPWSIPGDWLYFEKVTTKPYVGNGSSQVFEDVTDWSNVVIMGRRSFEARPMLSVPLFNRYNIVISRNPDFDIGTAPIVELATSLEEALQRANELVKKEGRIFILGGEEIYRQSLLECTHLLITFIYSSKPIVCDRFLPSIDPDLFRLADHAELEAFIQESVPKGKQRHEHFEYEFLLYVRK